jgi:hypothetical protein
MDSNKLFNAVGAALAVAGVTSHTWWIAAINTSLLVFWFYQFQRDE